MEWFPNLKGVVGTVCHGEMNGHEAEGYGSEREAYSESEGL